MLNEQISTHLELEAQRAQSLVAQVSVIQLLRKTVVALKLRQRGNGLGQPTVADSEPAFLAGLNHQLIIYQLTEHLFAQSHIIDHAGACTGAEKSQELVSLLLVEPTETAFVQIDSVHRCNRDSLTGRHIVVDAP